MVRHGKHEFLYVGPGFFKSSLDLPSPPDTREASESRLLLCPLEGYGDNATQLCFGVNQRQVVEVIDLVTMTAIPEVRGPFRGYIERQGVIIPVVDIAACIGLKPMPMQASARLVIARGTKSRQLKALVADDSIRTIVPTGWSRGASRMTIDLQYLRGAFHKGKDQLVIPDLDLLP